MHDARSHAPAHRGAACVQRLRHRSTETPVIAFVVRVRPAAYPGRPRRSRGREESITESEIVGGASGAAGAPGHAGAVTEYLVVSSAVRIPADELTWRFSRSSGPGGQGVNTTDSRVELSWHLAASPVLTDAARARAVERLGTRLVNGVLVVVASEHRSQLRNREAALARLAALVRDAIAPPGPARRATRPSARARWRRVEDKRRRGEVKRLRRPDDS